MLLFFFFYINLVPYLVVTTREPQDNHTVFLNLVSVYLRMWSSLLCNHCVNPGAGLPLPLCYAVQWCVLLTEEPGLKPHWEDTTVSWCFRESFWVFLMIFIQHYIVHTNNYLKVQNETLSLHVGCISGSDNSWQCWVFTVFSCIFFSITHVYVIGIFACLCVHMSVGRCLV